jgi:hypothetical protein
MTIVNEYFTKNKKLTKKKIHLPKSAHPRNCPKKH